MIIILFLRTRIAHSAIFMGDGFGFFDRNYALPKRILLLLKFLIEKQFRLYDRFIDAYIVPSEYLAGVLADFGISRERITVLPHFVSSASNVKSGSKIFEETGDSRIARMKEWDMPCTLALFQKRKA